MLMAAIMLSGTPARTVRVALPSGASAVVRRIAGVLARQVQQRGGTKVRRAGPADLTVRLAVAPIGPSETYEIADSPEGLRVTGADERGLLYGVGRLLRISRCGADGFLPGAWRGRSTPHGAFRAVYAATHFMNYYDAAPADEVQRIIEDLGLWGANTVIVTFPTWTFRGFDDPGARRSLRQTRSILKAAAAVGLQVGLVLCPNQGFSSAPEAVRFTKFPDDLGRRGAFGVNCCPSTPAGHAYLTALYDDLFGRYADVGLDYVLLWPYDEGGCGCPQCWPWGARGYPALSRDVVALARRRFPRLKAILSTWTYDTPPAGEWEGLSRLLAHDHDWLDGIMADSHTDFPRYPLERGVPGGLPLVNFPEISMWGRAPWGGYGANPLPRRFEALWKQTQGKLSGGMPYSEGIYEDINKVLCFQWYWDPGRSADDILREYVRFEYSPDVVDEVVEAVGLLEASWLKPGPDSVRAEAILEGVEAKLTPQARAAWRWRILKLRATIDAETWRQGGALRGARLRDAFDELTRIYHAEKAHSMPVHPPTVAPDNAGPV